MEPLTTRFNAMDPYGSIDQFTNHYRYLPQEDKVSFLQEVRDFFSIQAYQNNTLPCPSAKGLKYFIFALVGLKVELKDFAQLVTNISKVASSSLRIDIGVVPLLIPEYDMVGWIDEQYVNSANNFSTENGVIHLRKVHPSVLWTLHQFQEIDLEEPISSKIDYFDLCHLFLFAIDFELSELKLDLFKLFYLEISGHEFSQKTQFSFAVKLWFETSDFTDHLHSDDRKKIIIHLITLFQNHNPKSLQKSEQSAKTLQTGTSPLFDPRSPYDSIAHFVKDGFVLSKKMRELFVHTVFKYFSDTAYLSKDSQPIPEAYRSRFALVDLPVFLTASQIVGKDLKAFVISIQKVSGLVFDQLRKIDTRFLNVDHSPYMNMRWKVQHTYNSGTPGYHLVKDTTLVWEDKTRKLSKLSPVRLASFLSIAILTNMAYFRDEVIKEIKRRFKEPNVDANRALATALSTHLQEPNFERILTDNRINLNPDLAELPEELHSSVLILNSSINPDKSLDDILNGFKFDKRELEDSVFQRLPHKRQKEVLESIVENIHQQVKTAIDLERLQVFCASIAFGETCYFREGVREMYDYLDLPEVIALFPNRALHNRILRDFPKYYPLVFAEKLLGPAHPLLKEASPAFSSCMRQFLGSPKKTPLNFQGLTYQQLLNIDAFFHTPEFTQWNVSELKEDDFGCIRRYTALKTFLEPAEHEIIEALLECAYPGCQMTSADMTVRMSDASAKLMDPESIEKCLSQLREDVVTIVFRSKPELLSVYDLAIETLNDAIKYNQMVNVSEELSQITTADSNKLLNELAHVVWSYSKSGNFPHVSQESMELVSTLAQPEILEWLSVKFAELPVKKAVLNQRLHHLFELNDLNLDVKRLWFTPLSQLGPAFKDRLLNLLKDPKLIAVTTELDGIEERRKSLVQELEPSLLARLFNWK